MARKLTAEETVAFAEDLTAKEAPAAEEFSLELLGERRDTILSMSPELRAFFKKDSREVFSGS